MNAEFFAAVEDIEKEKGIPRGYMYEKIQQAMLAAFRKDNPEYGENLRYAALQYDTLLQTLTPEQASHLRDYQGMTALAGQRKEEAVFRSAFQAGLYLGSLARPPYTRRSL